jgi:molybdate transport system ATP-binding protein
VVDGLTLRIVQDGPIPLNVDFSVGAGQTLALVGASGAGKTTVLRAIAGLYRPAKGRITVGDDIWLDTAMGVNLAPQHRRVGFVFQSYGLFPHLTARGNVCEAMRDWPALERAARGAALLSRVQLEGLGDRFPDQLSGGQQQRVALARALARDPKLLLLDEPFSAVDQPTRRSLYALLAEIRASLLIPMVVVSHDVEIAARSADQICLISAGRTIETGTPETLLGDSASQLSQWIA